MLTYTTRPFETDDARAYVELAANAFSVAPEGARPTDSPALVAHWHGDANPAGRAFVTLARDEGRIVGHVSAVPARFLRRDGIMVLGWQIGCFVVGASVQRQGVGRGLLASMTEPLSQRDRAFVYGFPNPRSLGVLVQHGYVSAGRAPTWIACPAPLRIGPASRVRARDGTTWDAERLDAASTRALLRDRLDAPSRAGAFVRDRAYFTWRTLHAEADARYRFVVLRRQGSDDVIALALGTHRFKGLTFTILVDAWPDVLAERLDLLVSAAGRTGAGRRVYLNANRPLRGVPLRVRVPQGRDPRPVELLVFPGSAVTPAELAAAPLITADWMGF
jgi:predicted N-acetyltransferase YhbS